MNNDSSASSISLPAPVTIEEIVHVAVDNRASDIHLKAGMQPILRIDGQLRAITTMPVMEQEALRSMLMALLNPVQRRNFEENLELDASIVFQNQARVRINMYTDVQSVGCAMRLVPLKVPTLAQLGLPSIIEKLTHLKSGLVLVTGVTGAGKSTTLASMIDEINRREPSHIYTIEDPVEFVHRPVRSVITQREIGISTKNFSTAVRTALRADPNILLIGEMRDAETMVAALKAAETGLLVFSTLHTRSATKTIQRILGIFEPKDQEAIRMQLAYALKAVVCQQLLPTLEGGRRAFHEILINTSTVQEAVLYGEFDKLSEYMRNGSYDGMSIMDDSIYKAYSDGLIAGDVANQYALNTDEMERALRGATVS
ncbi:MAG: PilT/PilU family type 4a pilus ATPase [Cyanobacteria bacterium SZAS-4]|nr:PilT/PilU family type 4a pilus ATPase [Cyanobacteria bacterium SZAS-4]